MHSQDEINHWYTYYYVVLLVIGVHLYRFFEIRTRVEGEVSVGTTIYVVEWFSIICIARNVDFIYNEHWRLILHEYK